jgi:hypothetical protein
MVFSVLILRQIHTNFFARGPDEIGSCREVQDRRKPLVGVKQERPLWEADQLNAEKKPSKMKFKLGHSPEIIGWGWGAWSRR